MKGWKLIKPHQLELSDIEENNGDNSGVKVKITKALINISDLFRYNGEIEVDEGRVLGSFGVGVVSDVESNLFDLKKGDKVFVSPKRTCNNCYNCNNNNGDKCISPLTAGEDFDGFLSDFMQVDVESVYPLPENISENDALFINYLSVAENIVDSLNIEKGDYVAIIGTSVPSMILSQLLIYYQAVPIMISSNDNEKNIALSSGIYYTLAQSDNVVKEVSSITGGRMAEKVVYFCNTDIPVIKAFSVASYGANVAITGLTNNISSFSFNQALKKQLKINCINNNIQNTETIINLLINKAVDISKLDIKTIKNSNVKKYFEDFEKSSSEENDFKETIVDML